MRVLIYTICIIGLLVNFAIAGKSQRIDIPNRHYNVSDSIWHPEPGDRVYLCVGCMVKIQETKSIWRIIALNGMTFEGGSHTLNFDFCYHQSNSPDCVDVFYSDPQGRNNDIISLRFFKFKIVERHAHALVLEFVGFLDEKEPDLKPLPKNDDDKKEEPESKL